MTVTLQPRTSVVPRFGSDVVVDVGASNATQGNMRLFLHDKTGKLIAEEKTTVSEQPFTGPESFTEGFAARIAALLQQHEAVLKADPLESIVGVVPGSVVTVKGQPVVGSVGNLQTADGERLKNIQMAPLVPLLQKTVGHLLAKGKGDAPGVKVVITNDMPGGAAYVAQTLFNNPKQYQVIPGEKIMLIMTGGGMGVAYLSHFPGKKGGAGKVEISAAESGNAIRHAGGKSLEKNAASVHALVNNFIDHLQQASGLSLTAEQLTAMNGNGQAVTSYDKAKAIIPNLKEADHIAAANAAIGAYLDELAYFIQLNGLNMVNKTVLSGPLVSGIQAYLNELPDTAPLKARLHEADQLAAKDDRLKSVYHAQQSPLAKLLLADVWTKYTDDHTKSVLANLHAQTPLLIITDLEIPTNALGGLALKTAKLIGPNQNPTRLMIRA